MKVRIAFATRPDGNGGHTVDTKRVGAIEDHPDTDAKQLIKDGVAAAATEQDVADWESAEEHRQTVADMEAAAELPDEADLEALTKDELREQYPAAADQPANARKADLIAAIRDTDSGMQDDDETPTPGEDIADGSAIVTVAPGAESSPDVDPADRDSE